MGGGKSRGEAKVNHRTDFAPTDDCGVVRTYLPHISIKIVEGEATNIKITYPKDLEMIKA